MRYHPQLGLPRGLTLPQGTFRIKATRHAEHAASQDGLCLPARLNTANAVLFEVVTDEHGRAVKLGFRVPLGNGMDACLIVSVENPVWAVVTVWANRSADQHTTLRAAEYDVPITGR